MPGLKKQEGEEYSPNWGGSRKYGFVPRPNARISPDEVRDTPITFSIGDELYELVQTINAQTKTEAIEQLITQAMNTGRPRDKKLRQEPPKEPVTHKINFRCSKRWKDRVIKYQLGDESTSDCLRRLLYVGANGAKSRGNGEVAAT